MTRKQFQIREDQQHKIEVHVAGFCFRYMNNRIQLLVAKRTKDRELFPDRWECGGGQVNEDENFEQALRRQYFEELGIEVKVLYPILVYEIHREQGPRIPGVKFVCLSLDNGQEEITLNRREFSEFKWVTEREFRQLRTIPGVQKDAKAAFLSAKELFTSSSTQRATKRIGFQR